MCTIRVAAACVMAMPNVASDVVSNTLSNRFDSDYRTTPANMQRAFAIGVSNRFDTRQHCALRTVCVVGGAVCGAVRGVRSGWYAEGGGRCTECSGRRAVCATGGGHHWHWQQNGRTPRQRRQPQPLSPYRRTHLAAPPPTTTATAPSADVHRGTTAASSHYRSINGLTLRQRRQPLPYLHPTRTHTAAVPPITTTTALQTDALRGTTAASSCHCGTSGRPRRQRRTRQPSARRDRRVHTTA